MRLTLIQEKKVHSLTLPKDVSGQYIMHFTKANGTEEALLSIKPHNGAWCVECGMNAIVRSGNSNEVLKSFAINLGLCVGIRIKVNSEDAMLFVEDDSPEMLVLHKYDLNGKIVFGRNPNCDIVLKTNAYDDFCAEITADDKQMHFKCLSAAARVFVNDRRVNECVLRPGDRIFYNGYLFVCGQKMIALDKAPYVSVRTGGAITPYIPPAEETGRMEYYFDDVKDDKYIYVAPRFTKEVERREYKIVQPPSRNDQNAQPAVLSLGPAFTMGIASVTTGTFSVLNAMDKGSELSAIAPTLIMTGSMAASSLLWPVINKTYTKNKSRKDERNRKSVYMHYLADMEKKIGEDMEEALQLMKANNPDLDQLRQRIELGTANLWERSEGDIDFLNVCIGSGGVPFDCDIKSEIPAIELHHDVLYDEMRKLTEKKYTLKNAPVVFSLAENYICGIAGKNPAASELARSLVLQLAALHNYADLKIAVIYDRTEEDIWSSIRWLPHTWDDKRENRYVASDAEELKILTSLLEAELSPVEGSNGKNNASLTGKHYVVICASKTLSSKMNLLQHIAERPEYANFSYIAVLDEARLLPKESSIVLRVCSEELAKEKAGASNLNLVITGSDYTEPMYIEPLKLPEDMFRSSAVSLANTKLGLSSGGYKMPDMLTFLEMYGVKTIEELNCLQRWRESNSVRTLAAPLGVDSRGDLFNLDLHQKAHGPHGLIAGTTGSGKSEFIMTMILSLAVNYSPHDISFLLIDYKGGGMAVAFKELPHVAGIITNLDGAAVNRSLISIQSELKRRQALFLEEGKNLNTTINDIYKYQSLYKDGRVSRPLQHLYIVSDEFAELKSQQPEFMSELISAARIGRSLGVHLILATQKPSGVVNDQIWSNSRFKICLKVQERADSNEVIRCPDAAAITQTGRFYLQVGYNEIFELGQSAWAGAKYDPSGESLVRIDDSVEIVDNVGRVIIQADNEKRKQADRAKKAAAKAASAAGAPAKEPESQLQEITAHLTELATKEHMCADKLWLDPIPAHIYAEELEQKYEFAPDEEKLTVVMGEYDVPQKQEQRLLTLSPQDGNIIVYGSAGFGKTTFLNAYLYGMLRRYSAKRSVYYIIDCASETLRAYEKYNAVGAVCTIDNTEKIDNLMTFLKTEMLERKQVISESGGDYERYCKSHDDLPAINLVIANIGAFCESFDYDDMLEKIARDGVKLGIYMVVSQLNSSIRHRLAQNFSRVFCMQLNSGAYIDVLGSVGRMVPAKHKGRGLFKHEFTSEFQTAYITKDEDVFRFIREQAEVINAKHGSARAAKIEVLPNVFTPENAISRETDRLAPVVALDKLRISEVSLNLRSRMNVFITQNSDTSCVAAAVCEAASNGRQTYIFDAYGTLDAVDGAKCFKGDSITNGINELYDIAISRNKASAAAVKDGGEPIDYSAEQIVCVFNGLSQLVDTYRKAAEAELNSYNSRSMLAQQEAEAKGTEFVAPADDIMTERDKYTKIKRLLLGGSLDFGISMVIFDKSAKLAEYRSADWFAKHINLRTYFWIGGGIGMENVFRHQSINDSRMSFGEDMGYYVCDGKARVVRFTSTLTDES